MQLHRRLGWLCGREPASRHCRERGSQRDLCSGKLIGQTHHKRDLRYVLCLIFGRWVVLLHSAAWQNPSATAHSVA
jgi:hypothetical protein